MVGSLLPNWEILNAIGLMLTMSAWTGFLFGGRGRALTTVLILGSLALVGSFISILMAFAVTPSMPPWSTPILVVQAFVLVAAWVPMLRSKILIWIVALILAVVVFVLAIYRPMFRSAGDPMNPMMPGLPAGPPPAARPQNSDPRMNSPAGPAPFGPITPPPKGKKYVPPVPQN